MRTTLDINDHLYRKAKEMAASSHRTLTDLVEEGLRRVTTATKEKAEKPFEMPVLGGEGFAEGVDPNFTVKDLEEREDLENFRR
jgi:hypothetical protein